MKRDQKKTKKFTIFDKICIALLLIAVIVISGNVIQELIGRGWERASFIVIVGLVVPVALSWVIIWVIRILKTQHDGSNLPQKIQKRWIAVVAMFMLLFLYVPLMGIDGYYMTQKIKGNEAVAQAQVLDTDSNKTGPRFGLVQWHTVDYGFVHEGERFITNNVRVPERLKDSSSFEVIYAKNDPSFSYPAELYPKSINSTLTMIAVMTAVLIGFYFLGTLPDRPKTKK